MEYPYLDSFENVRTVMRTADDGWSTKQAGRSSDAVMTFERMDRGLGPMPAIMWTHLPPGHADSGSRTE
jgi:hypothetical protein